MAICAVLISIGFMTCHCRCEPLKVIDRSKFSLSWAVVVAQLVEQLLLTPEIHGLNPDFVKMLSTNCSIEKTKIKKKRP